MAHIPIHHAELGSIRYHKASTPYYYEVDNIPIIDLARDSTTLVGKVNEIINNMYTMAEIDQKWLDQFYVSKTTHFLDVSSSPPLNDYSGNNLQRYVLGWNVATFTTSALYEPKVLELNDLNYCNIVSDPTQYDTLQFVLSAGEFQFKPQMTTRILSAAELLDTGGYPLADDTLYMRRYRLDEFGGANSIDKKLISMNDLAVDAGGGIVPIEAQDYPGLANGIAPYPHFTDELQLSSVKIGNITSIYVRITASSNDEYPNRGTTGTSPANYQVLVCQSADPVNWRAQCIPVFSDALGYPTLPDLKTYWEWQGWIPLYEDQVHQSNRDKDFYLSIADTDIQVGPFGADTIQTFNKMYIELVAIETKQRQGNPRS